MLSQGTQLELYVDLPSQFKNGISTILAYILLTNHIPDMVLVNWMSRQIVVGKITVCFDNGIAGVTPKKKFTIAPLWQI